MKTKNDITYNAFPYGVIVTIPKGTPCEPATNLPGSDFWACAWDGMGEAAESWQSNYGFRLTSEEVEA